MFHDVIGTTGYRTTTSQGDGAGLRLTAGHSESDLQNDKALFNIRSVNRVSRGRKYPKIVLHAVSSSQTIGIVMNRKWVASLPKRNICTSNITSWEIFGI